jgi:hypothetical protein
MDPVTAHKGKATTKKRKKGYMLKKAICTPDYSPRVYAGLID